MEAISDSNNELNRALGSERDAVKRMDIYAKFEYSPALRARLKAVFGNERPYPVVRSTGPKGQVIYTSKLMPHTYLDENGAAFSWSELNTRSVANKAGSTIDTKLSMQSATVVGKATAAMLENLSGDMKQMRGPDGIWYGNFNAKLGSLVIRTADAGGPDLKESVRLEDLAGRVNIERRGKKMDWVYGLSVQSIAFGGDHVERANLGIRLANLPAQAMPDLEAEITKVQGAGLTEDAQTQVLMKSMLEFAKKMVKSGVSVVIDDISASYRGNTASIKGRVDFDKVVDADFKSPMEFVRKIVARFDVRLPVAMVNDVTRAMAGKQVVPSTPNAAEVVEMTGKNLAAMAVGKLVNEGYAVMDKDELRSAIEFKSGKFTFNGKTIAIPGMPAPAAAPAP